MKFRTEIPISKFPFQIGYDDKMMFFGSCFSEHFSDYFEEHRFSVGRSPFGILFNPLSIAQGLDFLTGEKHLDASFFDYFDEKWISFAHHGRFSNPDKSAFLELIDQEMKAGKDFLKNTDYLFLTFGTSYYYFHLKKEIIVANCHKVPAAAFEKRRASAEEIRRAFDAFFAWRAANASQLKVIFTVSPVRHLADGFHENQLSKANLLLAVDALCQQHPETYYFPSYEIFQDDLRDYRFYDKDLCHPSAQGIEYVKDIVIESMFSESAKQKLIIVEKEVKRSKHRELFG